MPSFQYKSQLNGINRLLSKLNVDIFSILDEALKEGAEFLDNDSTEKLRKRIYGQPPSPTYRRTGKALGGRLVRRTRKGKYFVQRDTRIKRARKNYIRFLNRNRRNRKQNTLFWTDAIKDTKKETNKIVKDKLIKALEKA